MRSGTSTMLPALSGSRECSFSEGVHPASDLSGPEDDDPPAAMVVRPAALTTLEVDEDALAGVVEPHATQRVVLAVTGDEPLQACRHRLPPAARMSAHAR